MPTLKNASRLVAKISARSIYIFLQYKDVASPASCRQSIHMPLTQDLQLPRHPLQHLSYKLDLIAGIMISVSMRVKAYLAYDA